MRSNGCPCCKFEKIAGMKRGSAKGFSKRSSIKHNDQYNYSLVDYKNASTKVKIICLIHGIFNQTPDKHLGGTGCPKCSNTVSRGEKEIMKILDNLNIVYEREKRFSDLHGTTKNSRLRYDFWLPEYNLLIEYDGEHHFAPVQTKGRLSKSEAIQNYSCTLVNDRKKNEYAKKNGYNLLRIKYDQDTSFVLERLIS